MEKNMACEIRYILLEKSFSFRASWLFYLVLYLKGEKEVLK